MRVVCIVAVLLLSLATIAPAEAAIIATYTTDIVASANDPRETYFHLEVGGVFRDAIFENFVITPDSVNHSYDADASSDPDFITVTSRLTDGVDQRVSIGYANGPGLTLGAAAASRSETEVFASNALPDVGDPDLSGYTISNIKMTVLSVALGTQTIGSEVDTYRVEFQFSGEQAAPISSVPEPNSCILLAGLGLGTLVPVWRSRRRVLLRARPAVPAPRVDAALSEWAVPRFKSPRALTARTAG